MERGASTVLAHFWFSPNGQKPAAKPFSSPTKLGYLSLPKLLDRDPTSLRDEANRLNSIPRGAAKLLPPPSNLLGFPEDGFPRPPFGRSFG